MARQGVVEASPDRLLEVQAAVRIRLRDAGVLELEQMMRRVTAQPLQDIVRGAELVEVMASR